MHRYDSKRRALALGIAGLAGFVDATGFLAANNYFVSFMSGNTTRFGVDLARNGLQALIPGLLLLGFVAGVTIGAILADRFESRRKTVTIAFSSVLLLAAATVGGFGSAYGFLAISVVAMGALNNTFRRDREVTVGVTYMTGALVRFGQGLAACLSGERIPGWTINLMLWISLAVGACGGAFAASVAPLLAPWIAAGISLVLLGGAARIERRCAPQSS